MEHGELSAVDRKQLWGRLAIRSLGLATIVLCSIYILSPVVATFLPLIAGMLTAWLLNPLVERIHKKIKIPRKILSFLFTVLVVTILGGAIVFILYSLINQAVSFISGWLGSGGDISNLFSSGNLFADFFAKLPDGVSDGLQDILAQAIEWLKSSLSALLSLLTRGLGDFITRIPSYFIGILVAVSSLYFILSDFPNLKSSVINRYRGGLSNFLGLVQKASKTAFGAYLKSQLLLSFGVFAIILIGFLIIQHKYAFLLALVLAVLDFIPIVGSGTVIVPWAILSLLSGNYFLAIALMVIWILASIYRQIFEPKIVGSQTGLSPLLTLMSIFTGMRFGGILGMILGPIILQITLMVARSGIFDGFLRDAKLFITDVNLFMKKFPEKIKSPEE